MSLTDSFGSYSQDLIDKFGRDLLDRYGVDACEAAAVLDDADISKGTARSYKPQVRQVIEELDSTDPDPGGVVDFILSTDKKNSTKSVMLVAMKKYYREIGQSQKAEELDEAAKEQGFNDLDFQRGMEVEQWITVEEVERIFDTLLPTGDNTVNEIAGPDKTFLLSLEHKALFATLYYTGCRVGEICRDTDNECALQVEDLYPESNQIEVYRLKKGSTVKREIRVVPDELLAILAHYMEEYEVSEGDIFDFGKRTAQNRISDIDKAYKYAFGEFDHMENLTPHKNRHGRVTAIANHSSLEDAGEYVSHSSLDITKAYRHIDTEDQKAMLPEFEEED